MASSEHQASQSDATLRAAGRGGLALSFAKAYFIFTGLLQQIALPRIIGMDGYGAFSSATSLASVCYNPITTSSIQGVSNALSRAPRAERAATLRRVMLPQLVLAAGAGTGFAVLAPWIANAIGAPHITTPLRILAGVLFLYALYTPLVGALNAERRFLHQAVLDIAAATLRTVGLVLGAIVGSKAAARGVEGATLGFVLAIMIVLLLALLMVGPGRSGPSTHDIKAHLAFFLPVLLGQILFNLLLQADLTILRMFAAHAALASGLPPAAADPYVGAYRATQLFGFLPFQLLVSLNFVLFPMLAAASVHANRSQIADYVQSGLRVSLLVAGLFATVSSGLAAPLLSLVFPAPAAALGASTLQWSGIGLACFAVFSVLSAILNGLQLQRVTLFITGLALMLVISLCWIFVRGSPLGPGLLWRTAVSTSAGLVMATCAAGFFVWHSTGTLVQPKTFVRVALAMTGSIAVARALPEMPRVYTLPLAMVVSGVYLLLLILTRELGSNDFEALGKILRRAQAPRRHA